MTGEGAVALEVQPAAPMPRGLREYLMGMPGDSRLPRAWPLPIVWLGLLGAATAMAVAALSIGVVGVLSELFFPPVLDFSQLADWALNGAVILTFLLWPLYVTWIIRARRLTKSEKAQWLFAVTFGVTVGMALFFGFALRRYLCLEGRVSEADQRGVDRLLARTGVDRRELTIRQIDALARYARRKRIATWMIAIQVPLFGLVTYLMVAIGIRQALVIAQRIAPNTATRFPGGMQLRDEIVLSAGILYGLIAGAWFFFLLIGLGIATGGKHEKMLLDFVRASVEGRRCRIEDSAPPD